MRRSKLGRDLFHERLRIVFCHDAFLDQTLRELTADGRMFRDLRCHQRLRVGGLVLLVVPVSAVAHEVDDDITLETPAVSECEADRRDRSFRVVGVDVDDRHIEALGEIARITRRASLARIRREAHLVVRDQMKRAADGVPVER